MDFWGLEVKGVEPFKCSQENEYSVRVTRACLDAKNEGEGDKPVYIYANKILIGSLSHDKFPHLDLDLSFAREFVLSHTRKDGSVRFTGSKVPNLDYATTDFSDEDDSSSEQMPPDKGGPAIINDSDEEDGRISDDKPPEKPLTNGEDEDDDESSDEDDISDKDEEDEDSDEEETPKKVELAGKKRAADSAAKTPAPDKKAKLYC